ncbi:hypothetical protein [Planomonospora algeriensis]
MWPALLNQAGICVRWAAVVDPARLSVTSDYEAAQEELAAAMKAGGWVEIREAVARFQAAVDTSTEPADERSEDELALISAVVNLRTLLLEFG